MSAQCCTRYVSVYSRIKATLIFWKSIGKGFQLISAWNHERLCDKITRGWRSQILRIIIVTVVIRNNFGEFTVASAHCFMSRSAGYNYLQFCFCLVVLEGRVR
jgi:hypothetical protein